MNNIWNPWHGCKKYSEGCANCYMYYLDRQRGRDGGVISRSKNNFDYPVKLSRGGGYKVKSGSHLSVCMTSDFFLEEADEWRAEAWDMIRERPDVAFFLITKRAARIADCLPPDWEGGWENVSISVTCENQRRADERIPLLLELPANHKGIICEPLIGPVSLGRYLADGKIERIWCGGENYGGTRPCLYDWVLSLRSECEENNVRFEFFDTGELFVKDGRLYKLQDRHVRREMARRSGASFIGKPIVFKLTDKMGFPIESHDAEIQKTGG